MGRKLFYVHGSFYRVSDRTGFPTRAESTKKMWNNLIVEEGTWEPRQPQDLVKGVKDQQSVPEPRPIGPAQFTGPIYAQMPDGASVGDVSIPVSSTAYMTVGDTIGIFLETGVLFYTTIVDIGAGTITIADPLPDNVPTNFELVDFRNGTGGIDFAITEDGTPGVTEGGDNILVN